METIHIDTTCAIGPVKPMNAVNNGPTVKKPSGGMPRGNFAEYRAAAIAAIPSPRRSAPGKPGWEGSKGAQCRVWHPQAMASLR